jgi:uncharacterized DUF497 family protein
MNELRIEWDSRKATSNEKKHKVSFQEASGVFLDQNALIYDDPDHSQDEERFLILGMSRSLRVLFIAYCYRENDDVIRIISARRADKKETQQYFGR